MSISLPNLLEFDSGTITASRRCLPAQHAARFGDGHRDRTVLRQRERGTARRPLPDAEPLTKGA
jgi:hypothetical protein